MKMLLCLIPQNFVSTYLLFILFIFILFDYYTSYKVYQLCIDYVRVTGTADKNSLVSLLILSNNIYKAERFTMIKI